MKMFGRKMKYYQADDCDCCSSKATIKRREERQWRRDLEDEMSEEGADEVFFPILLKDSEDNVSVLRDAEEDYKRRKEAEHEREEWINSFSGLDGRSTIGKDTRVFFKIKREPEPELDG
jgi:hypothetical protein